MEPSPPSAAPLRDVLAGRYRLDARVGAGGMATIYRARDLTLDRDVAVKILHQHLLDNDGVRERFRTEARHAAKLLHPHIVNVFDTGDNEGPDGFPWIVMEYVDGPSLRDVLREHGRLSASQTLSIVEPVALGLARAHQGGVVHRDIKPENVLITADGTPKIADFGIARALAEASVTQAGTLIGSVHYMAPELVSGGVASAATDQYALGVLLYELLTGEQPLPGESAMAIALRHAQEPVPPPSLVVPSISPALDAVVLTATAANPIERYRDLDALAQALRAAVPSGPQAVAVHARGDQGGNHTLLIPPAGQDTTVVASDENRDGFYAAKHKRTPRTAAQKRRRRLLSGAIALVVFVGALWALVLAPPIAVPDLSALTLVQAQTALKDLGLGVTEGDAMHSRTVAAGGIANQDPAAGGRVRKGGNVVLNVSLGPLLVSMPRVVGLNADDALARLAEHGFEVRIDTGWHDTAAKGTVAAQIPDPGSDIAEASDVVIYVSDGIEQVTVPDLSELDRDEAEEALREAKLTPLFVEVYSDDVPREGQIISQSPAADTTVDKGTTVEVQISKGAQTIKVPNVEGKKIADGRETLERLGLKVRVIEQARPSVGPFKRGDYGRVEAQDPQPGKKVQRGDTITLWTFSKNADERDGG